MAELADAQRSERCPACGVEVRVLSSAQFTSRESRCGRGGIGIRVRLRCVWGKTRGGSSPLVRTELLLTNKGAHSSVGRATRLHRVGQRFESS